MRITIPSDGLALTGNFFSPELAGDETAPAIVICHGFPAAVGGGSNSYASLPGLAEQLATEYGWFALGFQFRGTGESPGSFSIAGWLADVAAAVAYLRRNERVHDVWLLGFGTGAAIAMGAAVRDPSISGVASMSAPADFLDWVADPEALVQYARDIGAVDQSSNSASGLPDVDELLEELRTNSAESAAAALAPRPLLLLHGSDDVVVPAIDARALAEAHGRAELRIITAAGHQLRHDPRAMAVLFGWLERNRYRFAVGDADTVLS